MKIGLFTLFIIMILVKYLAVPTIPWWVVTIPLWPVALLLVFAFGVFVIACIAEILK